MALTDLSIDDPSSPVSPSIPGSSDATKSTRYGVASMGFSILGGLLKGMADWQSGDANAATLRNNAVLADLSAGDAMARGNLAAGYALLKGSAFASSQKAAYAGAGVDVKSGSAIDVLNDTKTMSDLDARIIQNNAAREAWGYQTKASQFRHQADIEESTARQRAGGDILGGIVGAAGYGQKMIEIS